MSWRWRRSWLTVGCGSRGRKLLIGPAQLVFAGALLLALTAPAAHATSYPSGFEERTVVGGLTEPTAMAWAPDDRLFVIEKPGRLKVVEPGGTRATTILDISSRVNDFHDRGLLGLAMDSAFASNSFIYLLYTYDLSPLTADSDAPMVSRLERYTVSPDNVVGSPRVLLGSYTQGPCPAPSNVVDCLPSDGITHSIGTVRSAPDGTLWVGSGDGASASIVDPLAFRTYDERSMAGKILHVDRDGRGLPGHPFCPSNANLAHVCTKVWAGGFRNPFRFKLRPGGGLAVGDVGWESREELDLIPTGAGGGKLYGWPCYEGSTRTNGYRDRVECGDEYAKEGTPNAHVAPDYDYAREGVGAAVLGGPTYTGTQYPAGYRDDVFVGDYALGFIRKANLDAQGRIIGVDDFATDWTGVDLEPDPNGDLAYASFGDGSSSGSGSIRRIVYSPGNASPVAVASATPSSGRSPLDVSFTGSSSRDADGDSLSYEWDFGDGSAHSTQANPTHRYGRNGVFTARLTVGDGRGLSDTETVQISVGDPPVASIDSPADGSLYRDGETVQLQGSATDPEDGALPDSAFHWTIRLHHGDHVHPVTRFEATKAPSFVALDDHDADSHYEVTLRVTDSDGLQGTRAITLRPETVDLTLESVPPGAPLSYGGIAGVGPMFRTAAVGYRTTISAAERFVAGGRDWIFERWSDGGARLHDVTVPASAATLTAHYRGVGGGVPADPAPGASSRTPPMAGAGRDVTPPAVRITSPARRVRVSGRVTVRASASDNVGVSAVQFRLDGKKLRKADVRAPFRVRWRTRRARNGAHRLTAVARDGAGNTTTSRVVRVIVRNKRSSAPAPRPRRRA
jgi:glucose/arabinose dehydrogenase/PKD repeat protein